MLKNLFKYPGSSLQNLRKKNVLKITWSHLLKYPGSPLPNQEDPGCLRIAHIFFSQINILPSNITLFKILPNLNFALTARSGVPAFSWESVSRVIKSCVKVKKCCYHIQVWINDYEETSQKYVTQWKNWPTINWNFHLLNL